VNLSRWTDLSRWNGIASRRVGGGGRSVRRRHLTKRRLECSTLEGRQLLSTLTATPVALSVPPAAAVANAAAILNTVDPTGFAQFQSDLAQAESYSRVTSAQGSKLAQDEAAIDQAIDAAGLSPDDALSADNDVQAVIVDAFFTTPQAHFPWAQQLKESISIGSIPPGSVSPRLIRQTVNAIEAVAREVRFPPSFRRVMSGDYTALNSAMLKALGPNATTTNLGAGEVDSDPFEIYLNGQVNEFIK
jgi:hypothetical protein